MIQPINTISFKSLWVRKDVEYSEKQKQCIADIQNHLKERIFQDDFHIRPGKSVDTVELSYIKGFDEEKGKVGKIVPIGEYSTRCPFNIDDLDDAKKVSNKNSNVGLIAFAAACLIALLSFAVSKCSSSAKTKQVIENAAPISKEQTYELIKDLPIWVK